MAAKREAMTEEQERDEIAKNIGLLAGHLFDDARLLIPSTPKHAEVGVVFRDFRDTVTVKVRITIAHGGKRYEERGEVTVPFRQARYAWWMVSTMVTRLVSKIMSDITRDLTPEEHAKIIKLLVEMG